MFNTYLFHIVRAEIIINKKMNKTVFDFHKRKKKELQQQCSRSKTVCSLTEFLEKLNKSEGLIVIENSKVECETAVSNRSILL